MPEPDRPTGRRWVEDPTRPQEPDVTDIAEFAGFYRATATKLVRFLVTEGASLADAAEIAQDTLSAAYTRWASIEHPNAWCYRVASRERIRRAINGGGEDLTAEPPAPNPLLRATPTDAWHTRQELIVALATLPPRQRQVLAWTLSGFTPAEIADELRLPGDQVRSNLRHARKALAARRDGEAPA